MSFVGAGIGSSPSMIRSDDGKEYLSFAGTDYLGLARHPEVRAAAIAAIERFGVGASASRRTTGTSELHIELESAWAEFREKEAACVLSSGYLAPKAVWESLDLHDAVVLIDAAAHPALSSAVPREVRTVEFRHFDVEHLAESLAELPASTPKVVGIDSVDLFGNVAPIAEIAVLGAGLSTIVCDDAHGVGILGPTGRGIDEGITVGDCEILTSNSLSKAIGASGGAVAGGTLRIGRMRAISAAYGGATALPNALAAAALAAVGIIRREPERRLRCLLSADRLANRLRGLGFRIDKKPMPIVAPDELQGESVSRWAKALEDGGILASHGSYPSANGRKFLRFVVTAEHTPDEIDRLVDLMRRIV